MNIKEIVQVPYTTNPRFAPINDVIVFKDYADETFEQRRNEFNNLNDEVAFESDLAKKECLVEKTSRAMQLEDEPFYDIIDMGLDIPDDIIIMHKGKVEAAFVAMASGWNPGKVKGMTLAEVHQPVADNEMLLKASEGIWRSMTSGQSFHRHTWGISPLSTLSNHPRHEKPIFHSINDLYFRVEHERTFTVDKDTAAFFIDVEVIPLPTVFHLKREYRDIIKESINSMTDSILDYKNLNQVKRLLNEQSS